VGDMEASTPAPPPAAPSDYPVDFHAERQAEYHRFLPLVKWLLAFPHYIALIFIGIGAFFALIGAFFAVLFTGNWPRGLFDFIAGTLRWGYRVSAYVMLLTDEYPPFSLAEEPEYPVRIRIDYPEHIDNWRPLVHWLLVIPYLIVAGILIWVAGIVSFIAIFVILFTKEMSQGMFDLIAIPMRWQLRGHAYAYWMVDRYPPFNWEE
jgi:hypothetical protein